LKLLKQQQWPSAAYRGRAPCGPLVPSPLPLARAEHGRSAMAGGPSSYHPHPRCPMATAVPSPCRAPLRPNQAWHRLLPLAPHLLHSLAGCLHHRSTLPLVPHPPPAPVLVARRPWLVFWPFTTTNGCARGPWCSPASQPRSTSLLQPASASSGDPSFVNPDQGPQARIGLKLGAYLHSFRLI
jgi:hypothetical protein